MPAAAHTADGAQGQVAPGGASSAGPPDLLQAVSLLCSVVGMLLLGVKLDKKALGADMIAMGQGLTGGTPADTKT
jgi:hypothetical protein